MIEEWEEFFRTYYEDQINELSATYPDQRSLIVEFPDIDRKSSELAEELLENPDRALSEATA
ncbi:MAG: hypothetical protein ACXQS7_03230, partial [Candidatus Syntropharchaeia archaeon]